MLRIEALHVENFGPFKGRQSIVFPREDGVAVIYGENMRGKTSLLNAIRFAFFGKVLGRGAKAGSLHKVGNWEEAEAGRYGFRVQLELADEQHQYKLTRSFAPRSKADVPANDADYEIEFFVERDGDVLGPQQAEAVLRRILPEQIARFFLFDGELLQEYEDLLNSDSDMGRRISESIERILGVPILTATRATLLRLKDKAAHDEAVAAQGDQRTREFGNHLLDLQAQRKVLHDDLLRLERDLEQLRSRKAALEELMKKRERLAALLDRRDVLDRQLREVEGRKATQETELRRAMSGAWSTLLAGRMRATREQLKQQEELLHASVLRSDILRQLHDDAGSECPACLQTVTEAAKRRIEDAVRSAGADLNVHKQELVATRSKLAALDSASSVEPGLLRKLWQYVEDLEIELATRRAERDEIAKQLETVDEDALRGTRTEFESTIRQLDALERGVAAARDKLAENQRNSDGIQRNLDRLAGRDLATVRVRRELYSDLHKLFDEAVDKYRDDLRRRVEVDATRHFKALTTEPDYEALRINESYGLTIVHRDGSDIPVRSAGAEHVVALALIAALQNNAPLSGPIVIDSPFGRLDRGHRTNIVRALPNMTKQVILLVYEEELPVELARTELKGKLRGEWRLERRSARHTELVPRKD